MLKYPQIGSSSRARVSTYKLLACSAFLKSNYSYLIYILYFQQASGKVVLNPGPSAERTERPSGHSFLQKDPETSLF